MTGNKALSRRVIKAMGLFGGTQVITILCSLIRSKLVALWIGPAGFGLLSIYLSVLELLGQISSLGIRSSAVRDVAANAANPDYVARIARIVGRWGIVLALAGFLLTAILSPVLSIFSFGNTGYILSFILLGVGVAMNVLTGTRLAVLQGLSRLKNLSRATIGGAVAGLLLVIPMYYYFRLDSILPSVIVYSAAALAAAQIFRERVTDKSPISASETLNVGRKFLTLGFFITISDILNQLAVYIFVSWMNINAGEAIVGLYQAGNTLFNRYVGLVFTAIAMEYYPRLTAVVTSRQRVSTFVSHEIKISLCLLTPIIAIFIATAPVIVNILYTSRFTPIIPFVSVAITGTTLRAISWCMAMVILARGDGRRFMITEGFSAVIVIIFNILGYKYFGLFGLGISYILWYLAYTTIVYLIYRYVYHLTIARGIYKLAAGSILILTVSVIATLLSGLYLIPAIIAAITIICATFILRRA